MKIKDLKLKTFFLFIFYVLCLIFAPSAHAQNFDIGIYPPIIQAQMIPPSNVKIPVFLKNYMDQSVTLKVSLKPFKPADSENGEIEFIDNPDLADPFIIQKINVLNEDTVIDSISLSPNEEKQLNLSFQIPATEPKGEYYFSLIFSGTDISQSQINQTQATGAISTNILLTVGPIGKTQGILEEFSAPKFLLKGPVPFNIRLRNLSDHFITPKGSVLITNMFNQTIGKVDLLETNVLADSLRRLTDKLQSGTDDNSYQKIKSVVERLPYPVAVWPETFLLGPYKATLTLALSDNGPTFVRTIYFFAFPAEYLIAALIIVAIISYIVIKVRKKLA